MRKFDVLVHTLMMECHSLKVSSNNKGFNNHDKKYNVPIMALWNKNKKGRKEGKGLSTELSTCN